MALVSSGQISISDIYTEINGSGPGLNAGIGMAELAGGTYGTINTNSTSYPNDSVPHAINEWYSYDHNASGTSYNEWTGDGPHPNSEFACVVEEPTTSFWHDGSGGDPSPGDTVYTDDGGTSLAEAGFYRTGCCYIEVDDSGVVTDDTADCPR